MSKTAIIYWSSTGNTEAMANAILDGAKEVNPDTAILTVSETSAADAAAYDTLILGCPAMGAENLEESLAGKNVALFGSYGWGDGTWMRDWYDRCSAAGASMIQDEGIIANEYPDGSALEACTELGKKAAAL